MLPATYCSPRPASTSHDGSVLRRVCAPVTSCTLLQLLAVLVLQCGADVVYAATSQAVPLSDSASGKPLVEYIDSWQETPATSADLQILPRDPLWRQGVKPLTVDTGQTLWMRVRLELGEHQNRSWLLTLPTTAVDSALFLGPINAAGETLASPVRSGLDRPYSSRPLGHERLVFPIQLTQPGVYTAYLKLNANTRRNVEPELWDPAAYLSQRKHKTLFDGICYGILATLLVYNLVLTGAFRSRAYLFYVLTCASALMTLSTFNGHAAHYLWPDTPWLIQHSYTFAPGLWLLFSALFARIFLSLSSSMPKADKIVLGFAVGALAIPALGVVGHMGLAQTLTEILAFSGVVTMSGIALLLWRKGLNGAAWYLTAQSALFLSAGLVCLINWGIMESPFLLANALQLGVSFEMIVFAMALSVRINKILSEKAALDVRATHLALAASTDPLTGVANRNGLAHAAARLLKPPGKSALLLIDLNRFKAVNDEHGHEAGDLALVETAKRLAMHLRSSDVMARTGGDEFVILLEDHPEPEQLNVLLSRLAGALSAPIAYRGATFAISASIGAACYPDNGTTLADLQRAADKAMYSAKQAGVEFIYSTSNAVDASAT